MKFRRLKAALLTGVMALSLAVPAFAATDPLNPTLKIGSTTQIPTINMQMPTSPAVVVNPYKLKVTIDKAKDIQEQIASVPMSVVNLSECPIQVGIKASAKVAGNAVLATASNLGTPAPALVDGKNNVYIGIAAKIGDKAVEQAKIKDTTDGLYTATAAGAYTATADGVFKALGATDADIDSTIFGTAVAASTKNTLKAGTGTKASDTKGYLNFIFCGDASTKSAWTAKDTVTPSVTFKFTPLADYPTT